MSSKYLLPCECGQKTPVRRTQAGGQVACSCGRALDVPSLHEIDRLEPVERTPAARRAADSAWGRREALILFGTLLCLGSLLWAGWITLRTPKPVDVRTMSPAQTWLIWQELQRGVNRVPSAEEDFYADWVKRDRWWRRLALGTAALGGVTALAAFTLMRPTRRKAPRPAAAKRASRGEIRTAKPE